jgi:putative hydroxymethylpyrimidine transport system substrate-binding protein
VLTTSIAISALLVAACGGGTEAPGQAESPAGDSTAAPATLRVALDWFPNPDHVALYYALDNGYFADQNLTVEFKTPSDVTAGLKLVATNQFDLSIFYEGDMFFAAQEDLPVIAVGSLVPQPLNSLMALADSKVQGPETVKGATIGVAGLPFDDAILDTIRQTQGLSEGDVKSVNVGFDLVPAMLSERVDAAIGAYFNIEGIHIESQTGEAPVIVKMEELGVPHYDELIVVGNSERLQSDAEYADAVRRFLAAMVEATKAAQADEAGSIESMKANTEYTEEEIEAMVPDTLPLLSSPKGVETGCFDLDDWATFGDWMLTNGLLEAPVDPATIATNEYLSAC